MNLRRAFEMAREFSVRIEHADLGTWGAHELRSEYDPSGPVIRVNQRVIESLRANEAAQFISMAVGHELYHHLEHRGDVDRVADRKARERAADAFALELLNQCHFERNEVEPRSWLTEKGF
ncbi:MAG: hypothetical protein DLM50_04325 [Candidatus Meridianibacter frigidus]|nr:MAG: hypothetical protein DLM50_04325 [Candidatus Eremiobacteraeota bacterium]